MKSIFNKILSSKIWWLILPLVAVGVYALSTMINVQLDLTAEKRYTLSEPTKILLKKLDAPVEVTVLLTGDNLPAGFKKLQNSTTAFLERCKGVSSKNFSYSFVDPETFMNDSINFPLNDTAKSEFLKSAAVKQNEVTKTATKAAFSYPVALVKYKDQFATVNLLQGQSNKGFLNPDGTDAQFQVINNAEALLEYQFINALYSLTRSTVPIVAYATGHGEPMGPETYDLNSTLDGRYRYFLYNLKTQRGISDSIKALIICKPTEKFTDDDKLKIDQYIMRGGKVMFLLDVINADLDSLRNSGKDLTAFDRGLDLDELLFKYGVRINPDLVQDLQCDVLPQTVGMVGDKPQIELLRWPYFPLLYPTSDHPIVKNMDAVVMQFPQSIDTVKSDGVKKTVLLSTSNTSRITGSPAIVTVNVLKEIENPSAWKLKNIPLAVLSEGKFTSLFANRVSQAQIDTMKYYGTDFLSEGKPGGKVIITGDGDWVLNPVTRQGPMPMGANRYTQYNFANKDFLLNCLDYLTDESGILQTRSKEYVLRMLDPKLLETGKTKWQWFNIALPLVLVLLAGAVFQWRRKRRFVK
ncbi:MAG: gliding motility-associated ABC transporter substrate-binding protein GldG [Chitinophagaceae bacterium]